MGVQRSEFDLDTVVDNVTRPSDSATGANGGIHGASAPVDENETIDITIDEDDHRKVFGSQSSVPPGLPLRSQTQHTSPPPSYDHASQPTTSPDTNEARPAREYYFLLPTGMHDSGILFNSKWTLSRVTLERDSLADAQSSPAPSSQDSSAVASNSSSIDSVPPPTVTQIEACKPHPQALFVPETLEWRLILDQSQMCRLPPPATLNHDADDLYEACNLTPGSVPAYETEPITIPAHDQQHPVQLQQYWDAAAPDAPLPVLVEFNSHQCYLTGKRLLSSPPGTIGTVIERHLLMRFKENRESDPAVGLTGPESFIRALRVLLKVIGNYVHGERRGAPTTSVSLTQKLGWDYLSRQIFLHLGWTESPMPDGRGAIQPPKSTLTSREITAGTQASDLSATDTFNADTVLRRNIRAWIELSAWLTFHVDQLRKTRPNSSLIHAPDRGQATRVLVHDASKSILDMIGWRQDHLDTTYRKDLPPATLEAFHTLGASSTTHDQLVKFAYLINMQANQDRRATELFTALDEVYTSQRRTSRVLEELIAYERSQGRYTPRDVDQAYERLHLSAAHLGPDVERDSIPLDLIVDNYKARAREVLINSDTSEHAAVKEALRVITLHLGSPERLVQALDEDVDMDIDQACKMLDANPDMADDLVLTVFQLYVGDAPARRDAYRHALRAIAEHRNSEYLRHFLRTGEEDKSNTETWQQLPSNELPAGIDNIGNTCYLNSVLQYFFSITVVRSRVLEAAATLTEPAHLDQLKYDTERRVGGQLITPRELQRSRRFVAQLGGLFHHLIHANALSVRPERELAYLALVSSRAEELEAEHNPAPETSTLSGDAENHADAPAPPVLSSDPPAMEDPNTAASGTNAATAAEVGDSMDITADGQEPTQNEASTAPAPTVSSSAPPLPPRPGRESIVTESASAALPPPARRNSLMQLGAQQDVSECLENCMFQLEVALAVSGEAESNQGAVIEQKMDVDGDGEAKQSTDKAKDETREDLLTSLFLGKTCQRIEADTIPPTKSGAEGSLTRPAQPHKQPSTHIKHEVFKIVPIDVLEEGRDIYDGFDGFFDSDTFVATSGAVQRRSVTLLAAPPLLQIQMQRVQYDRVTMRAFKSQAHLEMPETLYMDRYMDFDVDDVGNAARIAKRLDYQAKRKRIEELRAKLAACKDGANYHLTQTLSQAANAVEELARLPSLADVAAQLDEIRAKGDEPEVGTETSKGTDAVDSSLPAPLSELIDPGLATLLRDEGKLLRKEIKQAQEEIETLKTEMASIWADERRYSYRLVAVYMHRGEASHGHYFLNLRGGSDGSKWFKYNDSAVTETSLKEVLRDSTSATPYLVTYVRGDYIYLVDPICRLIDEQSGQEQQQQQEGGMEVEPSVLQDPTAGWDGNFVPPATWDSDFVPTAEAKPNESNEGEPVRPQVVTDAIQKAAGEAGNGSESPIKRARTDVL